MRLSGGQRKDQPGRAGKREERRREEESLPGWKTVPLIVPDQALRGSK
jgi:hypothetical protein